MNANTTTASGVRLVRDHGRWITRDGYTVARAADDRLLWVITAPQGSLGSTLTLGAARDRIAAHRNR